MLLGIWKNVEDLEESLNLDELQMIVHAARDREFRNFKAMAAVQGIDLEDTEEKVDKVAEIKMKIEAEKRGLSQDILEIDMLGFEIETEE